MRIIAGRFKGRRLMGPTWPGLRPTSDKLRETLFNVLGSRVAGSRVLDGFAGTGAVGIEALSRGASTVTFVEEDRRAAALVGENLARCGVSEGYVIIRASITRAAEWLRADPAFVPFDFILLDPPYDDPADAALARVADLLAAGGTVVLEHRRRGGAPPRAGRLVMHREIVSGDSALAFYGTD
jgi:16S rRNA (guanine(966)-N(2))-methyltransferase RsmD